MGGITSTSALANAKHLGYYSIGQAAQASGLTAKMIRHYESLALIQKTPRSSGNYRVYTANDVHALRLIKRSRALGFSLEEIETLLGLWRNKRRPSQKVKQLAMRHIAELDQKIEAMQSMRGALTKLSMHCHGDQRPECPILDDLGGLLISKQQDS